MGLSPLTIAARLTDLMQATEDIRHRAMESGRDHVALRAIEIERGLTITLADRLGIRATMALDELEFAVTIRKAMARLAYRDGETGEALAAVFESMGEQHIAADIRTMFPETRKALA